MIPHIEPSFDSSEADAVGKLISSGSWLTEYIYTRDLEGQIAKYLDVNFCYMYPNCTLAIYAACQALGIRAGDEVIVPDLTMIASATAVSMIGAIPVFVDVEPDTLCISVSSVEQAITPKTRGIVSVDLNGRSPDFDSGLHWIIQRWGLRHVEDAAQAFGSKDKDGWFLGSWGDVGCFSFSPHKIITTGQGGCCVTNHDTYAAYLGQYRNFGRSKSGGFEHETKGINLKFTDLQAVVGLEQMKKLEGRIKRKKEIFDRYRQQLQGYVSFLPTDLEYVTPWYIDIYTEKRDDLAAWSRHRGIGVQAMYPTIQETGAYKKTRNNPIAEKASREGLFLPSSTNLRDDQVDYVCDEIIEFVRRG